MSTDVRYLRIPLEIRDAHIPQGMSTADWKLFIQTLKIWKSRIVADGDQTSKSDKDLDKLSEE